MAGRIAQDPWLELARKQRAAELPELFETLTTLSRPATERRLTALASWPQEPALARHAAALLRAFPFDHWELAGATRALGLALLQGAEPAAFEHTRLSATTDVIEAWRRPALEAARRFAARGSAAPKPQPFTPGPLPLRPRQALRDAWLARAASRNPSALPELLGRLGEGPSTDLCARALELLEFPRDARIAEAVKELLLYPAVKPRADNPVFLLQGLLLCAHGDKKHAVTLRALAKKVPSLEWLPAPKDSAKPARRAPVAKTVDEASFLQAIAAAPADLSRRVVFADWLTERGDARGEFITLQLAASKGALAPKAAARMASLQKKFARDWLRSVDRCLFVKGREVFENGFLAEVSLRVTDYVPKPTDPVLATIERLSVWGGNDAAVQALLGSPLLAQVREFSGSVQLVEALCPAALAQLRELKTELESRDDLERLRRVKVPRLERLELDKGAIDGFGEDYQPDELYALPLLGTVKHLQLRSSVTPGPWLAAARRRLALETLTLRAPTDLEYHFDLKAEAFSVRAAPFCTELDERDLERLLVRPLESLEPPVRRLMKVELPEGAKVPKKVLGRLRELGVSV